MLHLKSVASSTVIGPFARLSRPAALMGQVSTGTRRYASTKLSSPKSSKSSSAWKIAGGITVLCSGGLISGGVLYNYNADVRRYIDKSLPLFGKSLQSLGLVTDISKEADSQGLNFESKKMPSDSGPLNLDIMTPKDIQPKNASQTSMVERKKESPDSVASLSSIDQTTVSAVDLAIAKKVEKEARQVISKVEQPQVVNQDGIQEEAGKQSKPVSGKKDSPSAAVSAVDFTGVSSIDLDIAASVEKMAEPSAKGAGSVKPQDGLEQQPSQLVQEISKIPVASDTNLTDKEVEAIVDQSAMEVMVQQTMENLRSVAQEAVQAQHVAAEAIKIHVEQLKAGLAQLQEQGNLKDLSEIVLSSEKAAADGIASAKAALVKVNEEVERLHTVAKEAEAAGAKEVGVAAVEEAAQLSYSVQKAALDMEHSKAGTVLLEEQQKYLQESREKLRKELEEIIPTTTVTESTENRQEKDVRSESVLLAFARKRLDQLAHELANHQAEEQKRLEQSLKIQRDEDAKMTELKLQQEAQRLTSEFETQLKKKEAKLAVDHETNLRQQLRRQAAAYSDHLAEVLRVQAAELEARHKEDLKQKLHAEREDFETQLKGALVRLQGVESVMESRADVERQYKQSQKLWAACQSLNIAIDKGADLPRPLLSQLTAIHEAASEDPIVTQVLQSLPEEAATRGVLNEETLRRRFYKVRRWCRRVAMIGENGNSPWTYLLSYLQSFLIFDIFDPRKEGELLDPENLDTFDLLARAEYYVRIGDLELATRLVNQLRGEARSVARDWLLEARLLLETRQAANLLTAYSAVLDTVDSE